MKKETLNIEAGILGYYSFWMIKYFSKIFKIKPIKKSAFFPWVIVTYRWSIKKIDSIKGVSEILEEDIIGDIILKVIIFLKKWHTSILEFNKK